MNVKDTFETRSSRPFDFAQGGLSLPNGRRTRREPLQRRVCWACSAFAFFVADPSGRFNQRLHTGSRTLLFSALALGLALAVVGCSNRAQQQAYERAAQAEQHLTVENAPALIADYRRVITLKPGSTWAGKAEERIAAVEARMKAEELHKAVFQEHGVD
jgi:hypothetical protein